jgi:hypothetical protein
MYQPDSGSNKGKDPRSVTSTYAHSNDRTLSATLGQSYIPCEGSQLDTIALNFELQKHKMTIDEERIKLLGIQQQIESDWQEVMSRKKYLNHGDKE